MERLGLEHAGWVTSHRDDDSTRRGPRRRMYRLTAEGAAGARRVVARAGTRAATDARTADAGRSGAARPSWRPTPPRTAQ